MQCSLFSRATRPFWGGLRRCERFQIGSDRDRAICALRSVLPRSQIARCLINAARWPANPFPDRFGAKPCEMNSQRSVVPLWVHNAAGWLSNPLPDRVFAKPREMHSQRSVVPLWVHNAVGWPSNARPDRVFAKPREMNSQRSVMPLWVHNAARWPPNPFPDRLFAGPHEIYSPTPHATHPPLLSLTPIKAFFGCAAFA